MSDSNDASIVIPKPGQEYWGIDGSIVLYGIIADILCVVPIVLYLTIGDTNNWARFHQTYVNMLYSAYMPIGIVWWIVLADDSATARKALQGSIEAAGIGAFGLLWVGMATHLMGAHDANALSSANWLVWMWAFVYLVGNILLIIMHYHLAPVMNAWIMTSPLNPLTGAIDNVTAWAQPEDYGKEAAPVEDAVEEVVDEAAAAVDEEDDSDEAF